MELQFRLYVCKNGRRHCRQTSQAEQGIEFSCYSNLRLIIATNIIVNVEGRCPELCSGVKVIEKILDSYA